MARRLTEEEKNQRAEQKRKLAEERSKARIEAREAKAKAKAEEIKAKAKGKVTEAEAKGKAKIAEAEAKAKIKAEKIENKAKQNIVKMQQLESKRKSTPRNKPEPKARKTPDTAKGTACSVAANTLANVAIQAPSGYSPVQAKIFKFYSDLRKVSGVITPNQDFIASMSEKFATVAASAAYIPNLKNYSKLENWFASALGWKSAIWNFNNLRMTEAGAIRKLFTENAAIAANTIELMATYKSLPEIKEMYYEILKSAPDIPEQKLQEILHDHIVAGQFPKLLDTFDSPSVAFTLQTRYNRHLAKLNDMGISEETIKSLDVLAGKISGNYDAARITVAQFGLDTGKLSAGGYVPIQVHEFAQKFIKGGKDTAFSPTTVGFDMAQFLTKSRQSALPAVLDVAKAAKAIGVSELDLGFMMTDPGALSKYLKDNFSLDEIDRMFENGTLFQLPALSDELFAFFNEGLGLPIDNLGEAIQLNPIKALQDYNKQLYTAVENASFIKDALETGAKEGWLLDSIQWQSLPNRNDFVQVGTNKALQEIFKSQTLRDAISQAYIHRTVADQLNALWQINVSVEKLGLIAQTWRGFVAAAGFLKKNFLMATGGLPYITRVFVNNVVTLQASTGNRGMFSYAQGLADTMRVAAKRSLDSLSNEAIGDRLLDGKQWTERSLYEAVFLKRATPFVAGVGDAVKTGAAEKFWERINPEFFKRWMKFEEAYHQKFGSPVTGKVGSFATYIKELGASGFDGAFEQLAWTNQQLDFAARWTAVKHLIKNPQDAGRTAWKDLNELLLYTDEYFNIQEDSGAIGKFVGQIGIPFFSFAMQAPGSALRHAMRHPARYGRMMLLYSKAQQDNGESFTDAELKQWQKDRYNIYLGRTPDGEIFSLSPGTVDFYLETTNWARVNFERLLRTTGQDAGSAIDSIDSRIDRGQDFADFLREMADKTYLSKAAWTLFSNTNPNTGEKLNRVPGKDTVLGVPMNDKTRTLLLEMLPVLKAIDNALPTSIVGAAPVTDPVTGAIRQPGEASWSGVVPRQGGKRRKGNPDPTDRRQLAAWVADNVLALSPTLFSPEANVIRTYKDLEDRETDLSSAIGNLNETIIKEPNRADVEALKEERIRLMQIKGLVQYNKILVEVLEQQKGYSRRKAVDMVRRQIRSAPNIENEALLRFMELQD